nr:hypothetical protein [Tanacetum cinerariifolium]
MYSITTQQAKLDLEIVPKEKRLEIRKCNERLNPGKIQREPTFQVVLDSLALTLCYSAFLITVDVPEVYIDIFKICPRVQGQDFHALHTDEEIVSFLRELRHIGKINSLNDVVVDHMHQPWRTLAALINKSLSRKTTGLDKLRLSRAQILWGMYLQKNVDYVELLWDNFIYQVDNKAYKNPEMKETQAYKTYLGFATGATPPKRHEISTKETTRKSKRVKIPVKKSTKALARGVVIRETLEMTFSKKKENVDVTRGKGIKLLSQVALTENAQFEEVRRKSMRDFYKTHPSGSGVPDVTEEESSENNENESDSEHETDESKSGSESNHEENKEDEDDEEEVKDEFVKTLSNDNDDEDETMITDKAEGDEDKEIDYTTSQLYDDIYIRLNAPVDTDKGFVQEKGTDAAMTNVQQRNENPEILQVIEDAHMIKESLEDAVLAKESSQPQSSYKAVAAFIEFELKKILIDKMDKSESYLAAPEHRECYKGLKKSYDLDKTIFSNYGKKSQSKSSGKFIQSEEPEFEVVDSDMPQDQEENPGPAFRLLKGTHSNYVELEYDFKECYKALSEKLNWENPEGDDYPFDLTKPLPLVMSGNSQKVPVKVAYDKHAFWEISHWREQHKTFYGYARGLQSTHDVYFTKRILAIQGIRFSTSSYGYLAVTQVEKKINVTKPETTKSRIKKREPYTPYQDPQGFTDVDNNRRNMMMQSDELYMFSDRTLTGLQTLLDDITNNIQMEYLLKRRCSTLEKKRANIKIKAIDKQQKERRMMRSLKKFVVSNTDRILKSSRINSNYIPLDVIEETYNEFLNPILLFRDHFDAHHGKFLESLSYTSVTSFISSTHYMENAASVPMVLLWEFHQVITLPPYQPNNSFSSLEGEWLIFHNVLVGTLSCNGYNTFGVHIGVSIPIPSTVPIINISLDMIVLLRS